MAKAIRTVNGLKIGKALLGQHGAGRGSVAQQVHDGDTVITELAGNVSVRFLGIDTPEISFILPGSQNFQSVGGEAWKAFLSAPFAGAPTTYRDALGAGLTAHLDSVVANGNVATNHSRQAKQSEDDLEAMVEQDMAILKQDRDTFHFFMAFSHEVMDGFGRLLCFLNRDQRLADVPEPRPLSYNERLLQSGAASPYFIWPNINPFRSRSAIVDAVPEAGDLTTTVNDPSLAAARRAVADARVSQKGNFDATDPLLLQPFELRFLARHAPPSRYVIDLSDSNTSQLLAPTEYHQIPNIEDRLFIPREYVPLFATRGWSVP